MPELPARNAPCPCGSGKKYRKCHGLGKDQQQGMKTSVLVFALIALAVAVLAGIAMLPKSGAQETSASGSAPGAPARKGQPWEYDAASNTHYDPSPGHEHWHSGAPPQGK